VSDILTFVDCWWQTPTRLNTDTYFYHLNFFVQGCCVGYVIRLDGITLEMTILERDEVGAIVEKMVETRLRWFEHAER